MPLSPPVSPSEVNLASTVMDKEQRVVLLTAANAGSGVTTSALALANELARSSRGRVLLVDASFSATALSQQLNLTNHPGFLDLLLETPPPTLDDCIHTQPEWTFDVLGSGHVKRYNDRLPPEVLEDLLDELRLRYRFVVIDAAAIYSPADTLAISALVDGVILVIKAEDTRWEVAQAAVQRLTQAAAKVIGCVFNERKYYMPKWIYDHL
ncbi:CpsD/CapB family tyrosine-protein kinase [Pseudomonas rhizoryzae]|uniref:CpsD/CapB family tyrosine-protein kinase n=1 Tax=Pseudomonas rhizoryzae TaxID=2571129 RepID=UPI00073672E2|nr:CpsD/CapB family tyrosine-protein kinase [Pseudomonas rhizoryzae]KTT34082.1 cobalamin biosynthesis protein CobQ [Pseudomonas psychrotolerans]KTT51761.1 cobalamin biosynthesis protein CobQ [Pseudomonas psychrotolerans]